MNSVSKFTNSGRSSTPTGHQQEQMLFTSSVLWDIDALLIIYLFLSPPSLSVFQPIERERFGVGCKNRPVASQEEQNTD